MRYLVNQLLVVSPVIGISHFALEWSEITTFGLVVIAAFFTLVFTAATEDGRSS